MEIVLESIIGRTVEQSMLEVQQEEEILRARWNKTQSILDFYVFFRTIKQEHMNSVKSLNVKNWKRSMINKY